MAIPIPTVDDFQESTVMTIIREILDYICGDRGLVDAINDNDIASFNSSYTNNVLKIDAVKGDGSIIPVCNVTIEGGSSTGSPYPTGVTITLVGTTLNFSMAMSSGAPITATVDLSTTFASKTELMNTPQNVVGTVTTARNGLMIASDKSKLDGIQTGANNYVLPIGGTTIGGVKNGGNVIIASDGKMNVSTSSIQGTVKSTTVSISSINSIFSQIDSIMSTNFILAVILHNPTVEEMTGDMANTGDFTLGSIAKLGTNNIGCIGFGCSSPSNTEGMTIGDLSINNYTGNLVVKQLSSNSSQLWSALESMTIYYL